MKHNINNYIKRCFLLCVFIFSGYLKAQEGVSTIDELETKANGGDAKCQWALGAYYLQGRYGLEKNEQLALKWFSASADQNYPPALFNLATMYIRGTGTNSNTEKAIILYNKAADLNFTPAIMALGDVYMDGSTSQREHQKGFMLYEKAAELGNPNAMFNTGNCYMKGNGVMVDLDKAIFWYRKAINSGFSHAQHNLDVALSKSAK